MVVPASRRPFEAVLFDFDGVLVKSMEQHAEAYRRILAPFGVRTVTDAEVFELEGKKSAEVLGLLARILGRPEIADHVDALAEEKNKAYRAMGIPPFYPGAREVVERLRAQGYRIGMATGTTRKNVEHILGDFVNAFDAIVTSADVRSTKPNPEPYWKAATALGVSPRRAVVVENAPLGIQSGLAAGARVLAVPTTLPREKLWEAHRILSSIQDVPSALDAAGGATV